MSQTRVPPHVAVPSTPEVRAGTRLNSGALLEGLFVSWFLFLSTGAVFPLLRRPHGEGTITINSGGPESALYAISFAITALLLFRFSRQIIGNVRANGSIWLLALFAGASVVWSTDPSYSLRAVISLFGSMMVGTYVGLRFDSAQQLRILGFALGTIALISALVALLDPAFGVEVGLHSGAWHGLYAHKNLFGRVMVLTLIVSILLCVYAPDARGIAVACIAMSGAMILLSQSRTSMVVAAVSIVFMAMRPIWRRFRVRAWMVGALLLAVIAGLGAFAWSQRSTFTQGDTGGETLTGRTFLWAVSILKVIEKPVLGHGFMAFWGGSAGDYVDVWKIIQWNAPNAHNAFLDVALDLGLVGLALFTWVCARSVSRVIALQRRDDLPVIDQVWPSVFLVFVICAYLTEGMLLQNNAYWMLFTAMTVLVTRLEITPSASPLVRPNG